LNGGIEIEITEIHIQPAEHEGKAHQLAQIVKKFSPENHICSLDEN
jgi:hypothetical protein